MDAKLAAIAEKVGHVDLADHILAWDKKQTAANPDARYCQHDRSHGLLQMHGSGIKLMCCVTRPTPCDYSEPVSRS